MHIFSSSQSIPHWYLLLLYFFGVFFCLFPNRSGFQSEDIPAIDKDNSSSCLDFINSPLLNSKVILSITEIVPLSLAIIFTVVLIYYLTVKLQRSHGISFSCEKMMLSITCLVVDFCLMLSIAI